MMILNATISPATNMMHQERSLRVSVARKHCGRVYGNILAVHDKREITVRLTLTIGMKASRK